MAEEDELESKASGQPEDDDEKSADARVNGDETYSINIGDTSTGGPGELSNEGGESTDISGKGEGDTLESLETTEGDSEEKIGESQQRDAKPEQEATRETSQERPYLARRSGVTDERSNQVHARLQDGHKEDLEMLLAKSFSWFNQDVQKTDMLEALIIAGMNNQDEVKATLRSWGYYSEK